ncbi:MAG: hypothetical protein C5B50_01810 [Verrucomicrobia bacterium]|nr:MAG: hypothetical protein C5B50_01810 [Verrucomicrobiota bacterium]
MNSHSKPADRVVDIANRLIADIQNELQIEFSHRKTKVSEEQLCSMLLLIQQRRESILTQQLPVKELRFSYLTREVTDSWPLGDDLANRVAEFEAYYNQL